MPIKEEYWQNVSYCFNRCKRWLSPSRSKIYLSPSSQWRGTIHYAIIPSVRKLEQSRHKHDVTFTYAEDIGG